MTEQNRNDHQNHLGLLILAGIGAGTLVGAAVGLMLGRRAGDKADAAMLETVDQLKEKAQHVLSELSTNVAELYGQTQSSRF